MGKILFAEAHTHGSRSLGGLGSRSRYKDRLIRQRLANLRFKGSMVNGKSSQSPQFFTGSPSKEAHQLERKFQFSFGCRCLASLVAAAAKKNLANDSESAKRERVLVETQCVPIFYSIFNYCLMPSGVSVFSFPI